MAVFLYIVQFTGCERPLIGPYMRLMENPIPVSAKTTGIGSGDYFLDGPNGMMEANMDEVANSLSFATLSAIERHPPKMQKTRKNQCLLLM